MYSARPAKKKSRLAVLQRLQPRPPTPCGSCFVLRAIWERGRDRHASLRSVYCRAQAADQSARQHTIVKAERQREWPNGHRTHRGEGGPKGRERSRADAARPRAWFADFLSHLHTGRGKVVRILGGYSVRSSSAADGVCCGSGDVRSSSEAHLLPSAAWLSHLMNTAVSLLVVCWRAAVIHLPQRRGVADLKRHGGRLHQCGGLGLEFESRGMDAGATEVLMVRRELCRRAPGTRACASSPRWHFPRNCYVPAVLDCSDG